MCVKKTIFKVDILKRAEYQLLRVVVGFNVDSVVVVIRRVLKPQR